jgi:uncharacterized protein DUF3108
LPNGPTSFIHEVMRRVSLAALIAAHAGCGGADALHAAPHPTGPVHILPPSFELGLVPGETMAFEVRVAGVLAGEAQLAVGEIGVVDGRRAVVVKSRAATAGAVALVKYIVDEATTVIDAETGRPISVENHVLLNGKDTVATAKFAGKTAEITYKRADETQPHTSRFDFAVETIHDAHTAMAALRGWRPAPGQVGAGTTRSVVVVGGRRLWRVDVQLVGSDTIGSAVGNRRAVVYEGKSYRARPNLTIESNKPGRTFRVWLSDDADRVPLRVSAQTELGDIVMELTEYTRP